MSAKLLKLNLKQRKYIEFFLILNVISLIFTLFAFNFNYFYDDAYISLRYAKHFNEGHGLVWNIGENIQGYTNFLHTVLIAFADSIFNDLVFTNKVINFTYYLTLALVLFSSKYLKKRLESYFIITNLTILASAPVIVWTLGGLETVLFTLLILLSFLEFQKIKSNLFLIGLYLNLAFLTRPDGAVFALIFFIYIIIKKDRKKIIYFIIPFIISVLYLIWTYNFYGSIVPNTYFTKSYGIGLFKQEFGLKYFYWFISKPLFLFPIYIFLKLFSKDFKLKLADSLIIFYSIYIIYVGGDHMVSFRFFVPLIPVLCIKIYSYLKELNFNLIYAYLILIMLGFSQLKFSSLTSKGIDNISETGKIMASYINKNFPKGSLIALNPAGAVPFYADEYKFIDMLGLNDTVISKRKIESTVTLLQSVTGHSKGDGKYVLSRKPDYIILGAELGTKDSALFLSDYELLNSNEFKENYSYFSDSIKNVKSKEYEIHYYKRNEN